MVEMAIEAYANGRLLGGTYRDQQFELKRSLQLAYRHHSTGPAEERIARRCDLGRKPQFEVNWLICWEQTQTYSLHTERLHAIEMPRRLMPETIASNIEQQTARRNGTAAGHQRKDRIVGGRGEDEIAWSQ
jgi:hypothetical protein